MSSSGGETFLNTKTRVRGVQDVITRMKNSEHGNLCFNLR